MAKRDGHEDRNHADFVMDLLFSANQNHAGAGGPRAVGLSRVENATCGWKGSKNPKEEQLTSVDDQSDVPLY